MLDPPTGGALTMTSTYQTRCTVTVGLLHRHRSGHFAVVFHRLGLMSEALFCDVWGEKNINCRNLQETQTLIRNPKP